MQNFQFSTKSLLLLYSLAATAAAIPAALFLADNEPSIFASMVVAICVAFLPAGAVFAGQYLLVYRPLKQIQRRESDPFLVAAQPQYPFFGLKVVHFILGLYNDFKLQRDAFGRLTEAYRSLCQLELDAPVRAFLKLSVDNELATTVSLKIFDRDAAAFLALHEQDLLKGLENENTQTLKYPAASLDDFLEESERERSTERFKSEIELALSHGESELIFEQNLYILQDLTSEADDNTSQNRQRDKQLLVLKITPRKLWTKFPKIYRRFFHALMMSTKRRILSNKPHETTDEHRDDSLARDFLAARNLNRVYIQSEHPTKSLPSCIGVAHRPSAQVFGDFIALSHDPIHHETIAVVGNIPGKTPLSGVAAHAALGVLAAELSRIRNSDSRVKSTSSAKLQTVVSAIHNFVLNIYSGRLGVELSAVFFDHRTGTGEFVSFGQPFPYLISPNERRPLVIGPDDLSSGMLGISSTFSFLPTSFNLLPGQILVIFTAAILALRDQNKRTFEKEIARGKLGLFNNYSKEKEAHRTATSFANNIIALATAHIKDSPLSDDLSLLCLAPYDTFNPDIS